MLSCRLRFGADPTFDWFSIIKKAFADWSIFADRPWLWSSGGTYHDASRFGKKREWIDRDSFIFGNKRQFVQSRATALSAALAAPISAALITALITALTPAIVTTLSAACCTALATTLLATFATPVDAVGRGGVQD